MKAAPAATDTRTRIYTARLVKRRWLSEKTFEIELSRPRDFTFTPGQHIRLLRSGMERDYSLVNAPGDATLCLCIRRRPQGGMSDLLATLAPGRRLRFAGPAGYFIFRPSQRPAVFVATGTGIAPFVAMIRAGARGFSLLHGVERPSELYYQSLLRGTRQPYFPCLPQGAAAAAGPADAFFGPVTACLSTHFRPDAYDFYLCGQRAMIRAVTFLADDFFPGTYVFTETFY